MSARSTEKSGVLELLGLAGALGAGSVSGVPRRLLARGDKRVSPGRVREVRDAIRAGEDPLGDALSGLRSVEERRARGAIYTPRALVLAMTEWGAACRVGRVVDPGAGSGRFLLAAGRRQPGALLVAVDVDPVALALCAANAAASGLAPRVRLVHGDFRRAVLPPAPGNTLFLGNPPYVRHHGLSAADKRWLATHAARLGHRASKLAGLHAHFFLRAAELAVPGDRGAFVTAAEWLDVNYGSLVRRLWLETLGGSALHVVEPEARPFEEADTTAVIACFEVGTRRPRLRFREVASTSELGALGGGRALPRERFEAAERWSTLGQRTRSRPAGQVELGELFAVHRGQVTGNNALWIAGSHSGELPERVCFPAVTRARELFGAGSTLADVAALRRVIDLPAELDELSADERRVVERFLRAARRAGVHEGFVARHRRTWWSVGLRAPAPILATYMARRPPAFTLNPNGARHINIAHGLYPREPMPARLLEAFARHLARHTSLSDGRTYAGGLTKFEPREMERLLVPMPEVLQRSEGF